MRGSGPGEVATGGGRPFVSKKSRRKSLACTVNASWEREKNREGGIFAKSLVDPAAGNHLEKENVSKGARPNHKKLGKKKAAMPTQGGAAGGNSGDPNLRASG